MSTVIVVAKKGNTRLMFLPTTAVDILWEDKSWHKSFVFARSRLFCPACSERNRMYSSAQIKYDYLVTSALPIFLVAVCLY